MMRLFGCGRELAAVAWVDWLAYVGVVVVRLNIWDLWTAEVVRIVGRDHGIWRRHAGGTDLVSVIQFPFVVVLWVYFAGARSLSGVQNVIVCCVELAEGLQDWL